MFGKLTDNISGETSAASGDEYVQNDLTADSHADFTKVDLVGI